MKPQTETLPPAPATSTGESCSHDRALEWLLGRINYERDPAIPYGERGLKLDRMRQLLTRIGQPDAGMKIIHVAGTKGKGSTSAMISEMLRAARLRTGVFSSPHLERIEERFTVDGDPCSAEELVALVDRLRPTVEAMDAEARVEGDPLAGPTYFEITTAIALLHFRDRQVDAAVLEVGLGGRLDSTNVCLPVVCVITSISFDHTRQLGNSLSAIAREKAGIIKPGVPVVCGVRELEPQSVIADVAREHGCRLIQSGVDFDYIYHAHADSQPAQSAAIATATLDFTSLAPPHPWKLAYLSLGMAGAHQAANASVALATIAELRHQGWSIPDSAIREGLAKATLPGRIEVIPGDPPVVLDTAHNPASARALAASLAEILPGRRRTLLLSISRDKDVKSILHELVPHFDRFIVTRYQENPRAIPTDRLAALIHAELGGEPRSNQIAPPPRVDIREMPVDAWRHALETTPKEDLIAIAGSFFLTAELRALVLRERSPAGTAPQLGR